MEEKLLRNDKKYKTIRICEPDVVPYSPKPLVQLTQPALRSKIEYTKPLVSWDD